MSTTSTNPTINKITINNQPYDLVTALADKSVTTSKIANDAVTTGKIADKAVTAAKLSDNLNNIINKNSNIKTANATTTGLIKVAQVYTDPEYKTLDKKTDITSGNNLTFGVQLDSMDEKAFVNIPIGTGLKIDNKSITVNIGSGLKKDTANDDSIIVNIGKGLKIDTSNDDNYPIIADIGAGLKWNSNSIALNYAGDNNIGGIELGYSNAGNSYGVKLNNSNKAYVEIDSIDNLTVNNKLAVKVVNNDSTVNNIFTVDVDNVNNVNNSRHSVHVGRATFTTDSVVNHRLDTIGNAFSIKSTYNVHNIENENGSNPKDNDKILFSIGKNQNNNRKCDIYTGNKDVVENFVCYTDFVVTGNTELRNDVTLGTSSVLGNILPREAENNCLFGSADKQWKGIYAKEIYEDKNLLSNIYAPKLIIAKSNNWKNNGKLNKNCLHIIDGSNGDGDITITGFEALNDNQDIAIYSILIINNKVTFNFGSNTVYWANNSVFNTTTKGNYEIVFTGIKLPLGETIYTATWTSYMS